MTQQKAVWTGAENLAPTGIRSPDRPASRQSLYRLSYPGRIDCSILLKIKFHLFCFIKCHLCPTYMNSLNS
jgi:hypothetical protein